MLLELTSQSADVNPIEHLWDELERWAPNQFRRSFATLNSTLFWEWDTIARE